MIEAIEKTPKIDSGHRNNATENISQLIGNTPLLNLSIFSPSPEKVKIFAKAEWFNPGHSVKDRPALSIIRNAIKTQKLAGGKRLLDASSGNTALSYAMLGRAFGIGVTLCVPANVSNLQKTLLEAQGAEVIYTSQLEGSDGAIRAARQLAEAHPDQFFYADQYSNPANWRAHYCGTANEIWRQTHGKISHFVAGLGTSGTFMGTSRRLQELNPAIKCFSVQPDSPFHGIEGLKHMETAIVPRIYDASLADGNIAISTEAAESYVLRLASTSGFLVGTSSGAALAAAVRLAEQTEYGVIVTLFPDSAQRYLAEKSWHERR